MKGKVAVVGCGRWGLNLIRNFHDLGALRSICDTDRARLARSAERYPAARRARTIEEVLADGGVDAVAIATPAATHYELARRALASGRDVFVEKPLAMSAAECAELVSLAGEKKRVMMVDHVLRFHPAVRRLMELVDGGELGRLRYIYSNRLNIGKMRKEENILWSFAPHDVSVILALAGCAPEEVIAFGKAYLQRRVHDTTITNLVFRDGLRAHIFVSWLHPFKEQKLVVVGSEKMAVFDDVGEEKLTLYPHAIEWENEVPVASRKEGFAVEVERVEPLREACAHFLECAMTRKTPLTDGREALAVLAVLEHAQRSLDAGGDADGPARAEGSACARGRRPGGGGRGYFAHESSYVDRDCRIGRGTKIWHYSHVLRGARIGTGCVVGQNVMIGPRVAVGDRCKIQNNVSLYEGVRLEDEVFVGPSAVFTNVRYPRAFIERKSEFQGTLVRRGATIGANATIVCGVTIGRYAFVGAGALVSRDVADQALVLGAPARQVGYVCVCGLRLAFDGSGRATCACCGRAYIDSDEGIEAVKSG